MRRMLVRLAGLGMIALVAAPASGDDQCFRRWWGIGYGPGYHAGWRAGEPQFYPYYQMPLAEPVYPGYQAPRTAPPSPPETAGPSARHRPADPVYPWTRLPARDGAPLISR